MNTYLVPANAKKQILKMGYFRNIDCLILGIGIAVTIVLLLWFSNYDNNWLLLVACLPGGLACLLVVPIANYHNVLVAIQSILRFYRERRSYIWKGWCVCDEYKDDKQ